MFKESAYLKSFFSHFAAAVSRSIFTMSTDDARITHCATTSTIPIDAIVAVRIVSTILHIGLVLDQRFPSGLTSSIAALYRLVLCAPHLFNHDRDIAESEAHSVGMIRRQSRNDYRTADRARLSGCPCRHFTLCSLVADLTIPGGLVSWRDGLAAEVDLNRISKGFPL
jgi:hypothetical protein